MARSKPCNILSHLREMFLTIVEDGCGLLGDLCGLRHAVIVPLTRLGQFPLFPLQTFNRLARIPVQPGLAFDIIAKLLDAAVQTFNILPGLRFLIGERIALYHQTLQHSRGDRLFFAQRWQSVLGLSPFFARNTRQCLRFGGLCHTRAEFFFGRQTRLIRLTPATIEQHPLGQPQFLAYLTVALRLFGLSSKLPQLRRKLLDHIIDAQQILFRILELQFCLMAALIQPRDTGRLFEHPTARFGFGVDQLGDLTLPHQRGRMRTG